MATTETAKLCIKCGTDCSGKPRSKDAQGRYICKDCMDALRASKPAASPAAPANARAATPAAPPVSDEGSVLASLLTDSPDPCPSCSAPLPKQAVLCNFCGYNKESGQATRTRVTRAPKEKRAKAPGAGFSMSPGVLFGLTVAIQLAPLGLSLASPELAIVAQLISLAFGLGVIIWTIVEGFKTAPITGILLLVTALIPLLNVIYWLYFVFALCENVYLRAIWLAQVLITVVSLILIFGGMMQIMTAAQG